MPEIVLRLFEWLDTAPFLSFVGAWGVIAVVGGILFGGWVKRREARPAVRGIDGEEYR